MPAYNTASYIKVAIDSVLSQSYENWELLIINDGSNDNTEEIINGYSDRRIKHFLQDNQGVSASRNKGLNQMSGDFFCFLDSDDFMPPDSLSGRIIKFQINPDIQYVDGVVAVYDQNLENLQFRWIPSFHGNPVNELLSVSGKCFFGPSWMIRRNKNINYQFQEHITHGEDLLFYINIAQVGGLYDYTNEIILHYRKGHQSAMKNLKGLEKGYYHIFKVIEANGNFSHNQISEFRRRARKIILRSYLGHYQPFNTLASLLKKW